MRNRRHTAPVLLAALLAITACAPSPTTTNPQPIAQGVPSVQFGVVMDVRGGGASAGAMANTMVGGIVGDQFGNGNTMMTGDGAVGGGMVGAQVAGGATSIPQWTVQLNNGRSIVVAQNGAFAIGQPVQVVFTADGQAHISAR
jgi:uncharacterized protein YcfJ